MLANDSGESRVRDQDCLTGFVSDDNALAGKVLKWPMASCGKRQGVCIRDCI